jgi:predicted peroxiredoxin
MQPPGDAAMANKLLVIMVNTDPERGLEVAPPLLQATVAATMEYDVEVVLSGQAGRLAVRGYAEGVRIREGGKTAYDLIREAHAAGVSLKVTTTAVESWGRDLIAEVSDIVGGAYIVSEAMDDDTVAFTY